MNLTEGVSNLSGTFTLSDALNVSDGSTLSAGNAVKNIGTLKITGDFTSEGTILVDFDAKNIDKIDVSGTVDLTGDNSKIVLNWLDEAGTPETGTDYTFFTASEGFTGLNIESIVIPEAVASYFLGVEQIGNALVLQLNPSAVPEPSAWILLIAGMGIILIIKQKIKFGKFA